MTSDPLVTSESLGVDDLYARADARTAWRRANRLRFGPAFRDGQLVTVAPLVRGAAFGSAYVACRAMDWLFHAVTGAVHVASVVAVQAGAMAAFSPPVTAAARRIDDGAIRWLAPVANRAHRLATSEALAPLRRRLPVFRAGLQDVRLLLATGPGRAAAGFCSIAVIGALVSLVSPVPLSLVLPVATAGAALRWSMPYLDQRYGVVERLERMGQALRTRFSRPKTPTADATRMDPPAPLDDPCPFEAGDPRRFRHLGLREIRELTATMTGSRPGLTHPDRPLWGKLAVTLRKVARGGHGRVWLLDGEGAPEKVADLLADVAVASVQRGEGMPTFDLSVLGEGSHGRVTGYYVAAAVRQAVPSPADFDAVPAAGARPLRVPPMRLEFARAREFAAQLLAGDLPTRQDAPVSARALHATTAVLLRAVDTGCGLQLDRKDRELLADHLCRRVGHTQREYVDPRPWAPETAEALQSAVRAHLARRLTNAKASAPRRAGAVAPLQPAGRPPEPAQRRTVDRSVAAAVR